MLGFLLALPAGKRQPNLLLASIRHLFGVQPDWQGFRTVLLANADAVRGVMLSRSTQTNEAARCAVLLPVLARLPQPLALVEVGASAGLCLLPDLYGYDYGGRTLHPDGTEGGPVFRCLASKGTPLPSAMPRIVWRAGLELDPIDVTDPDQAAWLETLVWPEQTRRLANLQSALRLAAAHRPRIVKGDLLGGSLEALCREAPRDATLVVFHTAVLAYVTELHDRETFAARASSLCPYWLCNEAPGVFPAIAGRAGPPNVAGRFLMSLNRLPMAWTDPHGAALDWIGP